MSDSFSTDDRGDTDGDGEAERSEREVGAEVSLVESSKSSSELLPLFSAPSCFNCFFARRLVLGVRSESSESEIPIMARVDDQVWDSTSLE